MELTANETSDDVSEARGDTNIPDGIIGDTNPTNPHSTLPDNSGNATFTRGHLRHRLRRTTPARTSTNLILRLEEQRHVTTLDISDGYYQTRLHLNDESTIPTVAPTTDGTDVPETNEAMFTGENMCVYLDDLIIHTNNSVTDHSDTVTAICARLATFGLELTRPSTRSSSRDPHDES